MARPRKASSALSIGAVVLGAFAVTLVVASAATTSGCSSAETNAPPDAEPPECSRGPFFFSCDPPAAGQPSCNTAAGTSPVLSRLPPDTSYPLGCTINFVGARDERGDCRLEAVCKCVTAEAAGVLEGEDAGVPVVGDGDAGDAGDGEGGVPPASPPPSDGPKPPAWLCSPP